MPPQNLDRISKLNRGHACGTTLLMICMCCYFVRFLSEFLQFLDATWIEVNERARSGDPESQYLVALAFHNGYRVQVNMPRAFELAKEAAEMGIPHAAALVGAMYMRGEGVPVNEQEAEKWLLEGGEFGILEAQIDLMYLYRNRRNSLNANIWHSVAESYGMKPDGYVMLLPTQEMQNADDRGISETMQRIEETRRTFCVSNPTYISC